MKPLAAAAAAGALVLGLLGLLLPGASGGYVASIKNSTDTVGSAQYFTCSAAYAADKGSALFQLPLTETSGTSAADVSGNGRNGTYQGALGSTASPGACSRDGGTAYTLNGSTSYVSTSTKQTNPTTFSIEVWFKTSSTAGGRLAGFDSNQTGTSGQYDRQLYVTTAGLLSFGVYNNGYVMVSSTTAVNDGAWHHAVATFAPAGTPNPGETLYLDGQQVAVATGSTTPQNTSGWWRFGFDGPGSWPNSGSGYFTGQMRYAAIYTSALTATQVQNHWAAGR